ncbi:fumarylacetoacetate hydrolase family protein [Ramlibacter sp.]|uniref:fumarylacetoacetate hydrolase family protein n=1 Tax=Ramlibacter sp. TaxID=1917967 RepID=UPI003D0C5681
MRLARFTLADGAERVGVMRLRDGRDTLLDVTAAGTARDAKSVAPSMMDLVAGGTRALDALRELVAWSDARGESWLHDAGSDAVQWLTPVPPRTLFAAGRNFGRHKMESVRGNPATTSKLHSDFPTGFTKLGRTLVPHGAKVRRPPDVVQFDYEVEIAVIVGQPLENASREQARDAIFGYTVFNDLSAREWQLAEMHNNLLMLGKNFPGFGPIGPCILTADEVPDPTKLVLWLKVNGETRQHSDCSDLIFGFDEMVAFWSRMGLTPGDVISTGTPEGVALHRKPDPGPYWLKPGDVVEAAVDGIGTLRTIIV